MIRYLTKHPEAFDPETLRTSDALDEAWKHAAAKASDSETVRNLLAERIVSLAKQGERNPQRLVDGALRRIKA